jgi:predicted Zn-dependent peptidase
LPHRLFSTSLLKTLKEIEKEIRSVTAEDIQKVAQKYLKPEKFHLAVIGPHKDQKAIASAFWSLGFPMVLF